MGGSHTTEEMKIAQDTKEDIEEEDGIHHSHAHNRGDKENVKDKANRLETGGEEGERRGEGGAGAW